MQISLNPRLNVNNSNLNFKSGCNIKNVYVNGKLYGQTQYEMIQRVAKALSTAMYKKTLSKTLMEKVYMFLPDFKTVHASAVACSRTRRNKINIIAGNDALVYKNNFSTLEPKSEQREKGLWILNRILNQSNNQQITVYAEENAGNLVITDIVKALKGRQ